MNFENEHARWMDGKMNEEEAAEFVMHHELDPLEAAKWYQSRPSLTKAAAVTPKHPDFLDASILQEIVRNVSYDSAPRGLLKLSGFAWSGAGVLVLAACISVFIPISKEVPSASEVALLNVADASLSVRFLKTPNNRSVALSLEGIKAIPAEVPLK